MFNFWKKREKASVLALSFSPFFSEYTTVLNRVVAFFESKTNLQVKKIHYCDSLNKDYHKDIKSIVGLKFDEISLLQLNVNDDMDKETELMIGFTHMENEVFAFCMLNNKLYVSLKEFYEVLELNQNVLYGFKYEIVIGKEDPINYLLSSEAAKINTIGLESERISKEKMWCFIKNQNKLLDGVFKDIFLENIMTESHVKRVAGTEFFSFLSQKGIISEVNKDVFYFKFENLNELKLARAIAYREKIVLCS